MITRIRGALTTQDTPLLDALPRYRYIVLAALGAALLVGGAARLTPDNDWYFFAWGSDMLFGDPRPLVRSETRVDPTRPGGLHLYASYPFLQIGPPPILLARLLQWGPAHGIALAGIVVQGLGLLFVVAVDRAFPPRTEAGRWTALAAGVVVTVGWSLVAHYRHLDDAMTLAAVAGAVWAVRRAHPVAAGALLGLAAASKPWGIAVGVLVLALPGTSQKMRAVAAAVLTAVVFWGPFLLADPSTLSVGGHVPWLAPDSPLTALGVESLGPGGPLRLVQFLGGAALAAAVVLRGRPWLAPLAAFSFRLALDPAANFYYPAAVLAAAYLADRSSTSSVVPWWTLAAGGGWLAAQLAPGDATAGALRLLTYAGLAGAVSALAWRSRATAAAPS